MNQQHELVKEILFDAKMIDNKVRELAKKIDQYYEKSDKPVILIGILRGCIPFLSQLILKMKIDCAIDFMRVESYSGQTQPINKPIIKMDILNDIEGRDILIVEDIIDSGNTLFKIYHYLLEKKPNSIKILTFLSKKVKRVAKIEADWFGFEVPDYFLIGYGLDYNETLRNLPYVAIADTDKIKLLESENK